MLRSRWEDNAHPDQGQNQIEKIRQHVIANEAIEYVWVDYLCMYQGARTKKQETEFKDMLPHSAPPQTRTQALRRRPCAPS